MTIKVLLTDNQALIHGAIGALFDLEPDVEMVAQVGWGGKIVATVRESGVDVCLLDIQVPGIDGVGAARQVRDQLLEARVVMVTTFDRLGHLRHALDAEAISFVMKTTSAARFMEAVRCIRAGLHIVDPQLANDLLFSGPSPLTAREQEVLRLARDGESVAKLARKLFLPLGAVCNHLSNAIGKTGVANRVEAARIATGRGWS